MGDKKTMWLTFDWVGKNDGGLKVFLTSRE